MKNFFIKYINDYNLQLFGEIITAREQYMVIKNEFDMHYRIEFRNVCYVRESE